MPLISISREIIDRFAVTKLIINSKTIRLGKRFKYQQFFIYS